MLINGLHDEAQDSAPSSLDPNPHSGLLGGFLGSVFREITLPGVTMAFILGIALAHLSRFSLPPPAAVTIEAAFVITACAYLVIHRQSEYTYPARKPSLSPGGAAIASQAFTGAVLLGLFLCLGFLQLGSFVWPRQGASLPGGLPIGGQGVIEEIKPLQPSQYTGPRYQITLKLTGHEIAGHSTGTGADAPAGVSASAGAGAAPDAHARIWVRQKRIQLTLRFDKGDQGEAEADEFASRYHPGALVCFSAEILPWAQPRNPGEFDYGSYMQTKGVYCRGETWQDRFGLVKAAPAWQRLLAKLRAGIQHQLAAYLDPKAKAVISACILGDQSAMERDDKDAYRQAGISHLFSVSGTHGGILLAAALSLEHLPLFQKRKGLCRCLALGFLLLYLTLTGLPMSMQRTFIMACMIQGAAFFNRRGSTAYALAAAALVMLWFMPMSLLGAGFQLSFGVTWGILHLSPWLRKRLPAWLAVPIAAQLASMPILAYWFYQVNPFGFLLNLLAVPLLTPILLLSGFAMAAGCVSPMLASLFWQAPGFLAMILDRAAYLWAKLPLSSVNVRAFPWPVPLLLGLALWALPGMSVREQALDQWMRQQYIHKRQREDWQHWQIWRSAKKGSIEALSVNQPDSQPNRQAPIATQAPIAAQAHPFLSHARLAPAQLAAFKPRRGKSGAWIRLWIRRRVVLSLLSALVLVLYLFLPGPLRITFLDVGQGDAVFFVTPGGSTWLSDAGSSNVSQLGYYRLEPFLRSQGINRLDYVLVSHPDADHISGVVDLLQGGWRIGRLITPPQTALTGEGRELIALAEEKGVEILYLTRGQGIRDGGVLLYCHHPAASSSSADPNDLCLVAELRYKDFSLLLTGDVDETIEESLLDRLPQASVLKVAHHGSKHSSSGRFLDTVKPKAAVVSSSKNNVYGHPHPDVIARLEEAGSRVYLTMDDGAVTVSTRGKRFTISKFL
ncbi:MAG: ComEC/Rec2 family competence protein [Clostridiales bacterium]|nr:ComEC/Rec2 family competence protein [Clostridiales bacterium]